MQQLFKENPGLFDIIETFKDHNLKGEIVENDPFAILMQCARKGIRWWYAWQDSNLRPTD
jgi:hypothetical protein